MTTDSNGQLATSDDDEPLFGRVGRDILIVDDDATNLVAIEAALTSLGRELVIARSGGEALERLLEHDFALIILDVAMPGMDGFETAKLVRSRRRNQATPIIFITGLSWENDAVLRGYELGAFDFLMKPIRPEVLRARAMVFMQLQEATIALREKAAALHRAQARAHERELVMQRRRWEADALEARMAQMADHDRRKDEFLAILAHELRNPLQPLQTAVELMAHDADQPVPARVRNIIQRQVLTIGRLVDDLLDVARFTAGKLDLRREAVTVASVVEEAVTAMRPLAEAREQTLHVIADPAPGTVYGDPVRLVQMVENLLSNAIKYTPVMGVIEVRSGVTGEQAFIRVTDNGKGIATELLPRLFDMFVQERVMASGSGGLGLGLGLVRRLVELHGGSVTASSEGRDRGATFEVCLPLAEAPAVSRTPTPLAGSKAHPRPLRAVVVDDAPDLRELVVELLRMHGHQVTEVEDGRSAVAAIEREQPDVALIDIGLPDMDGYAVARAVRSAHRDRPLRLIAMTGYGQTGDRELAFAAGFDAHIVKPASAEKIMSALHGPAEEPVTRS